MAQKKYDSTVARIAGNILSGYTGGSRDEEGAMVQFAVNLARAIVEETERTEPQPLADLPKVAGH